jgi:pimeloyl-ACP methyl ester carboxylesterase
MPLPEQEVALVSTVPVDGITVGYDDQGGGEPLVLVHGHPFDRSMWRPQVRPSAGPVGG